ncbi:MAG TPA: hypothetical protein VL027_09945 [Spongiibacteraceae bacterium]|nr:hypothetical protein [Spongiibacteraceae bacterium]HUH38252.1 hypothetical protein [Spongiibacteraceae bacterium]
MAAVLELVEVDDGEIVLRSLGDDSEPLLTIRFSEQSREYLMGSCLDVARAMVQAGIQASAEISDVEEQDDDHTAAAARDHTLH